MLAQKIKQSQKRPHIGRSSKEQKSKKEGGLGEGIPCRGTGQAFALLRLRIERFRFSLIKRSIRQYGGQAPQKNFQILLKEKNGGRKKLNTPGHPLCLRHSP